jgi:hypothetical protein
MQLHQRGDGLLRNGHDSKPGVTHITSRVAENLAGLDSYGSAGDVDSSALRHTHWCQLHQRGDGTLRNGFGSKPSRVLTLACENGTKHIRQLLQRGDGRRFREQAFSRVKLHCC